MNTICTIAWLTFHEARRRRMVLAALGLGAAFLLLFCIGLSTIDQELQNGVPLRRSVPNEMIIPQVHNLLVMAGLYVVHFLTIMLTIFASVDTVSGEIDSHTIQTLVTQPVRRWQVLLGKWLGHAVMIMLYLAALSGGVVLAGYLLVGYLPLNPISGLVMLPLEALVLLSLSLLGGTLLSTLTNGVVLFMLYGVAFIGTWVEQIGAALESESAVQIGTITSLLLPVEALWRRAAYLMQPPLAQSIPTPFASTSVPSDVMVMYAGVYALVALLLALRSFGKRDL
jgi:ABC-type transport system involved in multi-copper enzyme maturation permease subunit